MNYYVHELSLNKNALNTAGVKARDDFDRILDELGFQPLPIEYHNLEQLDKLSRQLHIYSRLRDGFSRLERGDLLFIQFPFLQTTVLVDLLVRQLHQQGVTFVLLVHDLETLRHSKRITTSLLRRMKTALVEKGMLKTSSKIIVHNTSMLELMVEKGISREKLVSLEIFDYLIPGYEQTLRKGKLGKDKPVIIAGNLRPYKAAYAYKLPENCAFNLYGVGYTGQLHLGSRYFGAFPPDDLPHVMRGSFGLVWDGESAETCSGIFGEYMRINCPHKISLYLAAGIPVAIWRQAAKADFVLQNRVGIVIESLSELREAIDRLSAEDYAEMVRNAERIGARLRKGWYSKRAVHNCLEALQEDVADEKNTCFV